MRRTFAAVLATLVIGLAGCDRAFSDRYKQLFELVLAESSVGSACGDERAVLIPQCVASVCFGSACEAHDQCYATCGVSRTACDIAFYADLIALCLEGLPLEDPTMQACLAAASVYWGSVAQFGEVPFRETQFNAGCDAESPLPIAGACCGAGSPPVCTEVTSISDCAFEDVFIPGFDCEQVASTFGGCPVPGNDDCATSHRICPGHDSDPDVGTCGEVPDTGLAFQLCSLTAQDCPIGVPCVPADPGAFRCRVFADNRLATTDGPPAAGECEPSGPDSFQADVWFEYMAPCSGALSIRMCDGTLYDSMLAVYGSHEPSGACVCPEGGQAFLACDDDSCFGFNSPSIVTLPRVVKDACYVIRLGGWFSPEAEFITGRGAAQLDVGLLCEQSATPP